MRKGSLSRLFPLILVVIVAVLFIAAVVSIGRALFNSGDTAVQETANVGRDALLTVDSTHSVQLTVRGPIVADENFRSYQITVSPSSRNLTTYRGYLESADKSKDLDNNKDAYEQFVNALDKANMMKGSESDGEEDTDLLGICATGYLYEYAVLQDDQPTKHLWTSTCDGSKGTLRASTTQLNNLFFAQIPGASEIVPFKASAGLRLQF